MKLASYRAAGRDDFGLVTADGVVSLKSRGVGQTLRGALSELPMERLREFAGEKPDIPLSQVRFLPVVPDAAKVICIGINYRDFAEQMGRKIEARPGFFSRFADTLAGHGQPVVRPKVSRQLDYEGELAVIIGKGGRYIPARSASQHVAGYTCFMDGSVRDYQKISPTAGKNFPSTGPLGPWLVTSDEIADPARLSLTTRINGEIVQQAKLGQMVHSVAALISFVSDVTELRPGDVLTTGTPGGVGHLRVPQRWLEPGDRIEVEISGIGTLANPVMDEAN